MSELLTFEWRRAKSIRTTWITSLFVIASIIAFAYLSTLAGSDGGGAVSPTDALTFSAQNPVALVLVASLAAMAFGHEYRYGTIRLTLTAFPRRPGVFFAKLAYTLVIVLAVVALGVALAYGTLVAAATGEGTSWTTVAWQAAVATVTVAVLAFTLTVITRSHPLGIIGPVVLNVLESVLVALLAERAEWLPKVLPFQAMSNWFAGGTDRDGLIGLGVWAAWMLGLLIVSFVLLMRRDA